MTERSQKTAVQPFLGHTKSWNIWAVSRSAGPHCKAQSAMQSTWHVPQTRSTATAPAQAQSGKQSGLHANPYEHPPALPVLPNHSFNPRPATAGSVSRACASRTIVAVPAYAACLRGRG